MSNFGHESFTYFQVDRPVIEGGDSLLRKVRERSDIVGTVTTSSLTEVIPVRDSESGDNHNRTVVRPLQDPLVDVFRANDLRMILYRRVVRSDNLKSYLLHAVEAKADYDIDLHNNAAFRQNDTSQPVMCDSIEVIEDLVYGRAMALLPNKDTKAYEQIQQAAELCVDVFDQEASELGRDSRTKPGIIPIASFYEGVGSQEIDNFCSVVEDEILPAKLVLGSVHAYRSYALSSQLLSS